MSLLVKWPASTTGCGIRMRCGSEASKASAGVCYLEQCHASVDLIRSTHTPCLTLGSASYTVVERCLTVLVSKAHIKALHRLNPKMLHTLASQIGALSRDCYPAGWLELPQCPKQGAPPLTNS